jgi:hypothetical protein
MLEQSTTSKELVMTAWTEVDGLFWRLTIAGLPDYFLAEVIREAVPEPTRSDTRFRIYWQYGEPHEDPKGRGFGVGFPCLQSAQQYCEQKQAEWYLQQAVA